MKSRMSLMDLLTKTVTEDAGMGRTVVALSLCYCPRWEVINKLVSGSLASRSSTLLCTLFLLFLFLFQQVQDIEW